MRTDATERALRGRGVKLSNEYQKALGRWYDEVPKAVLAALLVRRIAADAGIALAKNATVDPRHGLAIQRIAAAEWDMLHKDLIVPQPVILPEVA